MRGTVSPRQPSAFTIRSALFVITANTPTVHVTARDSDRNRSVSQARHLFGCNVILRRNWPWDLDTTTLRPPDTIGRYAQILAL